VLEEGRPEDVLQSCVGKLGQTGSKGKQCLVNCRVADSNHRHCGVAQDSDRGRKVFRDEHGILRALFNSTEQMKVDGLETTAEPCQRIGCRRGPAGKDGKQKQEK
jgi:hypothetical protein